MPIYHFHGGCEGCTNPLRMCPGCQYMEANWDLPDLNPVHVEQAKEKTMWRRKARAAAKKHTEGKE